MGSLVIVGTGIKLAAHITVESRAWIEQADQVFFLVNGPLVEDWLRKLRPDAQSLAGYYAKDKRRLDSYADMIQAILAAVRQDQRVCVVFYGHPGVFVLPAHEAIRRARQEGFEATMLPGISAEDCLFADLGFDPAQVGCQIFDATDFLVRPRRFDTTSGLILWQIGLVGNLAPAQRGEIPAGLAVLVEVLTSFYGPEHPAIIYEAAHYPAFDPVIQRVPLNRVLVANVTAISTMYLPPKGEAEIDTAMLQRLHLTPEMLRWVKG